MLHVNKHMSRSDEARQHGHAVRMKPAVMHTVWLLRCGVSSTQSLRTDERGDAEYSRGDGIEDHSASMMSGSLNTEGC